MKDIGKLQSSTSQVTEDLPRCQLLLSVSAPHQPNPSLGGAPGSNPLWYLHEPLSLNYQIHQTHFAGSTTLRKVLPKE